jgi:hypothetical protein
VNELERRILQTVKSAPGQWTAAGLALVEGDDNDILYGRYRPISLAIAKLRKQGLLRDVERCEHCKRPGRSHKPVPLWPA